MIRDEAAFRKELRELIEQYRARCLWFLAPDYYPETRDERLRVLRSIGKSGDLEAFKRAGALEQWLSASSSDTSAGS